MNVLYIQPAKVQQKMHKNKKNQQKFTFTSVIPTFSAPYLLKDEMIFWIVLSTFLAATSGCMAISKGSFSSVMG